MTKQQFQVLYRQFLFRMVDLEILSADGDVKQLLGQFGALLIWASAMLALGGAMLAGGHGTPEKFYSAVWSGAHFLIATTMLIVGLFAVLSWDSSLPDRRDVLVLTPLPVRPRTLFLAKAASLAVALSLTVAAFNGPLSVTWCFALSPPGSGLLGIFRALVAYWISVMAAGAFVFCALLGVQGLAAQLPRRYFLQLSSILQMVAFAALFCGYFLEPWMRGPQGIASPQLQFWPSYWFLAFFEQLNGWSLPGVPVLAARATTGLAIAAGLACTAFLLSYLRTIRKIVEEPDIVPGTRGGTWLPPFGNALHTAIVQFSIRSLMRSRQHRVIFAFYLGMGCAILTLYLHAGGLKLAHQPNMALMADTFVILCYWLIGTRVVIAIPVDLRANWVFRVTTLRQSADYLNASRRTVLALSIVPACTLAALAFFSTWPWRMAAGHLLVTFLIGMTLAELTLYAFRKVPFACSYLPGKSNFHLMLLGGVGLIIVASWFAEYEMNAMKTPLAYTGLVALLAAAAVAARWLVSRSVLTDERSVQFEDVMPPAVQTLGLNRDGIVPLPADH